MDVFCPGPACLPSPLKSVRVSLTPPSGTTNALAIGNSAAGQPPGAWRSLACSSTTWLYEEIKLHLLLCEVLTGLCHLVAAAIIKKDHGYEWEHDIRY